jgi:hypothetical protein
MYYIDFSTNQLNGTIPSQLFYPASLNYVYLFHNQLSGTIPTSFASSISLIDLFLDSNKLTGSIPPIPVGGLKNINQMTLFYNRLTGSIPYSLCAWRVSNSSKFSTLIADCAAGDDGVIQNECQIDFINCCTGCYE